MPDPVCANYFPAQGLDTYDSEGRAVFPCRVNLQKNRAFENLKEPLDRPDCRQMILTRSQVEQSAIGAGGS